MDHDGTLTFKLLYKEGDWNSKTFKNIKEEADRERKDSIKKNKNNSLTNFYIAMEDILIEELKGTSVDFTELKDEKETYSDEKIHDLFHVKSFSASTISKFNIKRIIENLEVNSS